ncbi:MAG TPA: hypothetical protein VK760_06575, partial [Candidatus Acidoferrales bacterium]|nr:hypothetical protein [Candidatus Acidoferrales bacterium]
MNQTFARAFAPAALIGLLLAGCSGASSGLPTTSAVPDLTAASPARRPADSVVWVTNFTDTTSYDLRSGKLLSTLTTGMQGPLSIVFDYNGNMYVGNQSGGIHSHGDIVEFAPGGTSPTRTIASGVDDPFSLAVDDSNNIYCANQFSNSVTVYASTGTKPVRTITNGINYPVVAMIDPSSQNLYVANTSVSGGKGSVTEYAPGGSSPIRTITTGLNMPESLALDRKGNLFVGNYFGKNVSEYAASSTTPSQVFAKGIVPAAITTDAKGNLYVAADGKKGVFE